ncbi:PREDICTED: defensin-like protein 159 [Nicotiana attenuata]|uniref:defensin-like protein 159 n=1 Tax=Nicotiana attenuata TaxID=49451 RepID=UPI0009050FFE|nr:PREDICTED: defensin-like protein 159 [Nicotiana attenuata]
MAKFLNSVLCFFLILSVALVITQINAQKRCSATLDTHGCLLADCQKECVQKYNGNGLCTGGVSGPFNCVCVYNCNSN